jgi:hypothetical protein
VIFFWAEQLPMKQHSPGLVRLLRGAGFVALLGAVLCGCGGFKTGTVTGKVTVNGTPANSGTVYFVLKDKQGIAPIEPDGTYKAQVPVGKVTVTIQNGPTPAGQKTVTIPAKYADAKKSGLEYEIKPGSQEIPLELTGSAAPAGPAPKGPGPRR